MRANSFVRSVGFAAVAAGGSAVWLLAVAPVVGWRRALALYLVCTTAAYLGGLGDRLRRRLGAALFGAAAGAALLVVAPGLRELALGLAVVIAVGRSVFLHRAAPARAAVTEAVLVIGGLVFADALGGPSLGGVVLGLWSFLLVQSLFFLVPGVRASCGRVPRTDPFEAGLARAAALLDVPPGAGRARF